MFKKIKNFLNDETEKITKLDIIAITIIVILYGILSFINLGDFKAPNTFLTVNTDERVRIELKNPDDVIVMKVYNGYNNAGYKVRMSNDGIAFEDVEEVQGSGAFAWDIIKPKKKAKYIDLEFTEFSTIGEVVLYNNSKELIEVKEVTYYNNKIHELTDETSLAPNEISYMNSSYFDEIYFARTAYEYIHDIPVYEWTHPPFGKLIQAIPIFITHNMSPFNYRLMGNISGILMLVVIYLFAVLLFKKRKYACLASTLLAFDTFHFVQTRMGTVDSHLVLFILTSVYFMIRFTKYEKTRDLFLSGLFFAFSISVKWTGAYGGLALAIIYFAHLIKNKKVNLGFIEKGTIFFVVIPVIFYTSLYFIFPNNEVYKTNNIDSFVKQQQDMYNYHSKLQDDHFFSSKWYTWPISYKPVWLHEATRATDTKETISGIGNIFIWYLGIVSYIFLIVRMIMKKDKNSFPLLVAILSLWLPYVFIGRVMFLYHYFPVIPFMILSVVYFLKEITERYKLGFLIPLYLVPVILFFIVYYPVISGMEVPINYIDALKLLPSWYF